MLQAGASGASLRDFQNYLVTSPTIDGEWSDPVYLNASGFDPSLFHDDDGRKYLTQMLWDHRPGQNRFAGILLQEYSPVKQCLIGGREVIFRGTEIGFTEGPHLYRRGDYYYLLTAEGGTGWGHAVTMARSSGINGPYELHPDQVHPHFPRACRGGAAAGRDTPTWWRRRVARRTWSTFADVRSRAVAAVRSAAKRRFRRWSGKTTAGCITQPERRSLRLPYRRRRFGLNRGQVPLRG